VKLLTFPIRLLFRLVLLPVKLVLATLGLTFRTGFKVGTLPVKGGFFATRRLGFKAVLLFVLGLASGVALAKRFGPRLGIVGADEDLGSFGLVDDSAILVDDTVTIEETFDGGAVVVEDTVVVEETPDGGALIIEDTVIVEETPDGETITETITVEELSPSEVAAEVEAALSELVDESDAERGTGDV
jgi:hypothetical protein